MSRDPELAQLRTERLLLWLLGLGSPSPPHVVSSAAHASGCLQMQELGGALVLRMTPDPLRRLLDLNAGDLACLVHDDKIHGADLGLELTDGDRPPGQARNEARFGDEELLKLALGHVARAFGFTPSAVCLDQQRYVFHLISQSTARHPATQPCQQRPRRRPGRSPDTGRRLDHPRSSSCLGTRSPAPTATRPSVDTSSVAAPRQAASHSAAVPPWCCAR